MSEPIPELAADSGIDSGADIAAGAGESEGLWSALREIGLRNLLRVMPGLVRSAFSGREPAAEPSASALKHPGDVEDIAMDFGDSAPTSYDDASAAGAEVTPPRPVTEAEAVADAGEPVAQLADAELAEAVAEMLDDLDLVAEVAAAGQDSAQTSESTLSAPASEAVAELGEVAW